MPSIWYIIRPKKGLISNNILQQNPEIQIFLISGINGLKCLNKMKYINQKYFLHVKSMHMQFAFVWKKKSQNNQEHC